MRMSNNIFFKFLFLFIVFGTLGFNDVQAQIQEIKWLRVGSLHSWYSSFGSEIEIGRIGDQLDGLRWDAQFAYSDQQAAKGLWIGATNYEDRTLEAVVPYKVISVGTRFADAATEIIPIEFYMEGRYKSPTVIVDGNIATDNFLNDIVDVEDENLSADRIITNKLNTYLGLSYTRKMMAFSQQNHDNYFIYSYTFKNTGIVDDKDNSSPQKLTDLYIFLQYRYGFGKEARAVGDGWAPNQNIAWGRNAVNHQIGQDPSDPSFEMRAHYTWFGKHSAAAYASLGCPYYKRDGRMDARQFVGVVTLHADKSSTDKSDDLFQPRTTMAIGSDDEQGGTSQFHLGSMTKKYERMASGHEIPTQAEKIGNDFADLFGDDGGGYSQGQGFGPYTLEVGDSITIVLAEGIAGISREKADEVGANWLKGLNGEVSSFDMPDGSTGSDPDEYKDAWVLSGKDSLIQTFRRAIKNYNDGINIPIPPPPPSLFEVRSGGDRINLKWSNNAESHPNFAGYRLYRAIGKVDTFYTKIFECGLNDLVSEYNDISPIRGFDYYYYIQSIDDGSTNDVEPGEPLASSKFFTMTNVPAYLRRPGETKLSEIRVVPNPFDVRSRSIQFGSTPGATDRIAFYGLPPECKIRIFTERGDLIKTITHVDGSGDELWNSLTESNQLVVSGIYIVHFEVTKDVHDPDTGALTIKKGETTFRKLIVIR